MSPDAERRRRELMPTASASVDLELLRLCKLVGGHRFEGAVVDLEPRNSPRVAFVVIGRCQVCGLGAMTDG